MPGCGGGDATSAAAAVEAAEERGGVEGSLAIDWDMSHWNSLLLARLRSTREPVWPCVMWGDRQKYV